MRKALHVSEWSEDEIELLKSTHMSEEHDDLNDELLDDYEVEKYLNRHNASKNKEND